MKTYKELKEGFGKEALQKKLADKGFGTADREKELLDRKKEMETRHAKADAEMAERDRAWKEKYSTKLKEGFFSLKKKVLTAKEIALKNNAPKMVDGNAIPPTKQTVNARKENKAGQSDKQDWSFK